MITTLLKNNTRFKLLTEEDGIIVTGKHQNQTSITFHRSCWMSTRVNSSHTKQNMAIMGEHITKRTLQVTLDAS